MIVRRERAVDAAGIAAVHRLAFATAGSAAEPVEVRLVAALRGDAAWLPALSLVAVGGDDAVVGHVVCTRAGIGPTAQPVLGLGPLGVDPGHQGSGVGTALMHAVLAAAEALDEPLVALLGDPGYYGRFGFAPAEEHGVIAPDDRWGAHFQVRLLHPGGSRLTGRFRYAAPFDAL